MTLWKKGKLEIRKYYELKMKRSTDMKTLFFGIVLTLLTVLPFLLILIQFFNVYFYHPKIRIILIIIAWLLLLLCNGLSNYYMVRLSKLYYPENPNLMEIDEKAIFIYETFNIGFAIFTFILVFILRAYT